jgi:hypothetical protein
VVLCTVKDLVKKHMKPQDKHNINYIQTRKIQLLYPIKENPIADY